MENTMNKNSNIQNTLDILRREARGALRLGEKKKNEKYKYIMLEAERNVNILGGDWPAMREGFSREFADLMNL